MVGTETQNKDWRLYENVIFEHFREVYPNCDVKGNQKLIGIKTQRKRQIDILIENETAGFPIRIVIDCKHFSKKIDVKTVEQFIGMLEDVKASKGVVITNIGYTKAAIERAKFDSRDIQLDIVDFEDLPNFSGTADAFPSKWNESERMAAVFSCPFGWVVHETPKDGICAGLTKIGLTWEEGWKSRECIYMTLMSKNEFPELKDVFALHEKHTSANFPGVEFDYFEEVGDWFDNSFSKKLVLRVGYYPQYPETEITVFLDFDTFYAFFVLSTPKEKRDQNAKKLAFIIRTTIPFDLPMKTSVLPFEYLKFHFIPNLFGDKN